jgi:hypothetical protein
VPRPIQARPKDVNVRAVAFRRRHSSSPSPNRVTSTGQFRPPGSVSPWTMGAKLAEWPARGLSGVQPEQGRARVFELHRSGSQNFRQIPEKALRLCVPPHTGAAARDRSGRRSPSFVKGETFEHRLERKTATGTGRRPRSGHPPWPRPRQSRAPS